MKVSPTSLDNIPTLLDHIGSPGKQFSIFISIIMNTLHIASEKIGYCYIILHLVLSYENYIWLS